MLQVLTCDTHATGADLLCWLRSRWRIENMFKYASEHNGIDALADYRMDIGPDTRMVTNPARVTARARSPAAKAELAAAERALPQLLNGAGTPHTRTPSCPAPTAGSSKPPPRWRREDRPPAHPSQDRRHPAGPGRETRLPTPGRRGLQMVLRLLAFNAEAWLAERFNAYLADTDEHRAITRHLLHLGGQSSTAPPGSPSPSTGPTRPGSPAPSPCSPTSSTTHPRTCPATAAPSPTRSARLNLNAEHFPTWGGLKAHATASWPSWCLCV